MTEAAKMLLQQGKVEKALEFAEQGDDQELLGDAHYAQALALMASKNSFNQKIISHLTRARNAYTDMKKTDSVGMTILDLAIIKQDLDTAKLAFLKFRSVQPYPNEVGMLEALDLVVQLTSMDEEFADIMTVIRGVDSLFKVMQVLLKPATNDDFAKSQLYLQFYGLHVKGSNTLVVYPNQKPRCGRIIPELYAQKLEGQQLTVEKNRKRICVQLSFHFVELLKKLIDASRDALRSHVSHRLQCRSHMEGEECPDEGYCPYLHENYNRSLGFRALEALLWEVHMDCVLQTGAENMKCLVMPDMEAEVKEMYGQISSLIDEDTKFDSCERLLAFILPEHHHMRNLTENRGVARELNQKLTFGKVRDQVSRYLEYSWKFQEKELDKMVNCFARAALFSPLFKLKIDINEVCQNLEQDRKNHTPSSPDPQADFNRNILIVERLGRQIFDVHQLLQKSPLDAITEYSNFVKTLRDSSTISVFQDMPLFFLLQEVFICITFFGIAKLSAQVSRPQFILPTTYLATIPFVNITFFHKKLEVQELVEQMDTGKKNLKEIRDGFMQIALVMCGPRINLLRMIFKPVNEDSEINYLQAERALVFALVLLVNIGAFVPIELEPPLMSTIMMLHLSEKAPHRLQQTLRDVKQSRGIADVAMILRNMLQQREEEYLLACHWRWDDQHKQGTQFQQLKEMDQFPRTFHRFDATNMDEYDGNILDMDHEEELDMMQEVKRRRRREMWLIEDNQRRDKAAKVIQRFFKWWILIQRLASQNLTKICLEQEQKEVFAPFEITEKRCAVCGIAFQSEELTMISVENLTEVDRISGWQSPDLTRSLDSVARSLSHPGTPLTRMETHKMTEGHIRKSTQFETYQRLYKAYFELIVPMIRRFITINQLRDSKFTSRHYPDQELELARLTSQMNDVLCQQKVILDERKWDLTVALKNTVIRLYEDYERLQPEIIAKYKEYLEQRSNEPTTRSYQQKASPKEMHKVEDLDKDIIDVLQESPPVRRDTHIRTRSRKMRAHTRDRGENWRERGNNLGQGHRGGRGQGKFKRLQMVNEEYQQKRHQVML